MNFAFLQQLDLFGNPLAEEPDYRLKIIYLMPQIKTLDRHVVTVQERIKAKQVCEENYGLKQGNGPTEVKDDKSEDKSAKKSKRNMKEFSFASTFVPGPREKKRKDGFSGGELDLYAEYNQIMARKKAAEEAEEALLKSFLQEKKYDSAPVANFVVAKQNKNKATKAGLEAEIVHMS